ncbi:MAG: EF-hand domain-containing protein [Candidatus Sericytochromatia bacterium]
MKNVFSGLIATVLTLSALSACGTPAFVGNAPLNPGVNSFANRNMPSGNTRTNAGLDNIAKRMRTILFNQQDANRDGILHRHEATFVPAELYGQVDKNKDGMWQPAEFLAFNFDATSWTVPSRQVLREMAKQAWAQYNRDNNAFITLDEMLTVMSAAQPPASCPGGVGKCPSDPAQPPSAGEQQDILQKATSLFNSADKNFDRKLDLNEFEDLQAKHLLDAMEAPTSVPGSAPRR